MRLDIIGTHLPGRRCGPLPQARVYDNVHVGIGRHPDAASLFPGDAKQATWTTEVRVVRRPDGSRDVRGKHVDGKPGERFVYVSWGEVGPDGSFELFRAAKLRLSDVIDAKLTDDGDRADRRIVGRLRLSDRLGHPVCASVRPPQITWSVEPADGG